MESTPFQCAKFVLSNSTPHDKTNTLKKNPINNLNGVEPDRSSKTRHRQDSINYHNMQLTSNPYLKVNLSTSNIDQEILSHNNCYPITSTAVITAFFCVCLLSSKPSSSTIVVVVVGWSPFADCWRVTHSQKCNEL